MPVARQPTATEAAIPRNTARLHEDQPIVLTDDEIAAILRASL
jgi:hypothetical protein